MEAAFALTPISKPGFLHRVLRQLPKANAPIALNNMLAYGVRQVSSEDVERVAATYRLGRGALRRQLEVIYRAYLYHCLADRALSDEELADLTHLKRTFALTDKAIAKIHGEVAVQVFSNSVEEVIADGRLDENEKQFLAQLQKTLGLGDDAARKLYRDTARRFVEASFANALSDSRLSPDEERELAEIQRSLGITLEASGRAREQLERCRALWIIDYGELPVIETGLILPRNERCHFGVRVEWYEHRKVTRRVRYGGPTASIRLAKGVYWRMGDIGVQRVSDDVLTLIDSGAVYLTNKRVLFQGARKNVSIQLRKILNVTPFKNGVDIDKDTGKSPFLKFDDRIDIFVMLLNRLIRELE